MFEVTATPLLLTMTEFKADKEILAKIDEHDKTVAEPALDHAWDHVQNWFNDRRWLAGLKSMEDVMKRYLLKTQQKEKDVYGDSGAANWARGQK